MSVRTDYLRGKRGRKITTANGAAIFNRGGRGYEVRFPDGRSSWALTAEGAIALAEGR